MRTLLNNSYIQNVIDFIFPQLCLGCAEYCDTISKICSNCEKNIQKITLPYCLYCMNPIYNKISCKKCKINALTLYSYANYGDPTREIIIQFKFKGITSPAKIFAKRIYDQYHILLKKHQADYLVPIPLFPYRENTRGYNQASIFANELSNLFKVEVNEDILERVKKRKPQAKLAINDRKKNIQDVFQVNENVLETKRCIIVDDVVTTGNTVLEAIKVLEQSNYKVVAVISIAHAF